MTQLTNSGPLALRDRLRRPNSDALAKGLGITIAVCFASYFVVSTGTTRLLFYLSVLPAMTYLLTVDGLHAALRCRVWQLAAALCLLSLLSLVWSVGDLEAYFDAVREPLILVLFLTGGVVLAARQRLDERLLVGLVLAAAGVSGLLVLALSAQPELAWGGGRLIGFGWAAKNPNVMGSLYGAAGVAALATVLRARGRWLRVSALGVALVCVVCVVLSGSRTAMLGLVAAALTFGVARNWRAVAAVLVALAGVFAALSLFGVTSIESLIARGGSSRLEIWIHTLPLIGDAPIFGAGSASGYAIEPPDGVIHKKAHNVFVGTAYHLGGLGLAVLVLLTARVVWSALKFAVAGHAEYLAALTFGYAVLSLNGHTLVDQPQVSWFVFWLPTLLLVQREWARRSGHASAAPEEPFEGDQTGRG